MANVNPITIMGHLIFAINGLKVSSKNVSTLPKVYGISNSVSLWTEVYDS